jgi:hypothetical protein
MINLSPINKKVRETLAKRSTSLLREGFTDPLAPIDNLVNTTSRSIWVKMFSPVITKDDGKTVEGARIFGGEVFEKDDGDFPIIFGYGQTYGRVKSETHDVIMDTSSQPLKRPLPGITNFECTYEGGISAIRMATINVVIWSMEDLERLTPNFFAHGRGVLLEWGFGSIEGLASTETVTDDQMINGEGYNKINKIVMDNGGLYDGMAGVISNYSYSLRDDGGFDCEIKLVSRGVNVLNEQLDNSDASFKAKSGDDSSDNEVEAWPTLDEFSSVLEEELLSIAVPGTEWFTSTETIALSPKDTASWDGSTQPPGVFVYQDDATLSMEKRAGPYVTWGWLEDNILSKWVGRFDKNKKVVNQFRSIEPVIDIETGDFIAEAGGTTTDIEKAKFESVKISNNKFLVTPHMDRWVLPGQFPADQRVEEGGLDIWDALAVVVTGGLKLVSDLIDYFHTSGDEFRNNIAAVINTGGFFEHFPVDEEKSAGYLRNMLISTSMIRDAFKGAKTLKEGMQNLFDDINSDVDGFWSFTIVNDPYLAGNIKVVDTKNTVISPEKLLTVERKKGNPESALYVFDSWGEMSIVKKQDLSVELPSSFAVSAMYAGTAKEGAEESAGATDESTFAKMTSATGEDPSQPEVVKPSRIEGRFGSQNPYLLEGAGALPSADNKHFGPGKGIGFKKIDYVQLMEIMEEQLKGQTEALEANQQKVQQGADDNVAKLNETIDNFIDAGKNKALYDSKGNLGKDLKSKINHKQVMNNILKGQVNVASKTKISKKDLRAAQDASDLFPVELSIEIDGVGGIFPGNCFHVNYIQERFKKYCVFQIFGVSQSVSKESWTTTLVGKLRVATGLIYENLPTQSAFGPQPATKDDDTTKKEEGNAIQRQEEEDKNDKIESYSASTVSQPSQVVTSKAQVTELFPAGRPYGIYSAVAYSYDKNKPKVKVAGEAKVEFQIGNTSDEIRRMAQARSTAENNSRINYQRKHGQQN